MFMKKFRVLQVAPKKFIVQQRDWSLLGRWGTRCKKEDNPYIFISDIWNYSFFQSDYVFPEAWEAFEFIQKLKNIPKPFKPKVIKQ